MTSCSQLIELSAKENNGVVMLVFYSGFVNTNDNWDNKYQCTTVDHAVDHAWHIGT